MQNKHRHRRGILPLWASLYPGLGICAEAILDDKERFANEPGRPPVCLWRRLMVAKARVRCGDRIPNPAGESNKPWQMD
jgi:hypothetical protein